MRDHIDYPKRTSMADYFYRERKRLLGLYIKTSEEKRPEYLAFQINRVREQIDHYEKEIKNLGIAWFGVKRDTKRRHKDVLKVLRDTLDALYELRNLDRFRNIDRLFK